MTQLIIDGVELPETLKGGYKAWKEPFSVDVKMVAGRIVRELQGSAWKVTYQYGYFNDDMKNKVIAACEKGRKQVITCGFLPPSSSGALTYSQFFVIDFQYPKFMWSRLVDGEDGATPVPMWADFSVELQEVKPSD